MTKKYTYDYDKQPPILYGNVNEEEESVKMGLKQLRTSSKYPKIGVMRGTTQSVTTTEYSQLFPKAVPWPAVKAELLGESVNKYEYDYMDNAKAGDIVEYVGSADNPEYAIKGKLYILNKDYKIYNDLWLDDEKCKDNCWDYSNQGTILWKLVKTKPGSEAKVGDTVISIDKPGIHIPRQRGSIHQVTEIQSDSRLGYAQGRSTAPKNFRVLCKAEQKKSTNLPIENAKAGDVVEFIRDGISGAFITNNKYVVKEPVSKYDGLEIVKDSLGSKTNGMPFKHFELVPEPPRGTQEYLDYWHVLYDNNIELEFNAGTNEVAWVSSNKRSPNTFALEYSFRFRRKQVPASRKPKTSNACSEISQPKFRFKDRSEAKPGDRVLCVKTRSNYTAWKKDDILTIAKLEKSATRKSLYSKEHGECSWIFDDRFAVIDDSKSVPPWGPGYNTCSEIPLPLRTSIKPDGHLIGMSQHTAGIAMDMSLISNIEVCPDGVTRAVKSKQSNLVEETTMSNNKECKVQVIVDGVDVCKSTKKVKELTDLEASKQYNGIVYAPNGSYHASADFKSKKEAKKYMQQPAQLGKTLKLWKEECTITTNIPLIETKA